jgi:perosamine synthetase
MGQNESTDWKIPLYKIFTDDEDINLVTKIIKRGSQWALGPEIDEFEKLIKEYVGVDYCLTFNSGTSALHATLLAYGIKEHDEVIVPSFSFIATANSTLFVKAKPVFADIEDETLGLDPTRLTSKINSSTKAIIPMDYGGSSCKIHEIKKIAQDQGLILIEDAAESLGTETRNKKTGAVADSSIFSFCGNKVLTTGEGGAAVTNSKEIYEKLKLIRSHGRIDNINYFENESDSEYLDVGYNWRMSSMTAALGISQIKKIDKLIGMRQKNAKYISSRLSKHKGIIVPKSSDESTHIFQLYSIRLYDKSMRDALHNFLTIKRIFSKIYFKPIHLMPHYTEKFKTSKGMLPVTEKVYDQILTLPMYPNMNDEEKEYLVDSIDEFFEKYQM